MADIRINSLPTTASASSSDDYIALDGTTNGTRKLNAYSPTFGGNLTVSGTSALSGAVKLGSGSAVALGAQAVVVDAGSEMRLQLNSTDRPGIYFTAAGSNLATMRVNSTAFELLTTSGTPISISQSTLATTFGGNLTVSGGTITGGTSGLSLASGGTNQSITLTPSGTGATVISKAETNTNAITTALNYIKIQNTSSGGTYIGALEFYTWDNRRAAGIFANRNNVDGTSGVLSFAYSTSGNSFAEGFRLNSTGNLLLGTTTDSGNGKLQLATHTTSAGGIGFGTALSMYRSSDNSAWIDAASGNVQLVLGRAGTANLAVLSDGSNVYASAAQAGMGMIFRTNGSTTALTLDSSQRTILSGALRLNNAYTASAVVPTGYVTIQDSTGTTYKVCVLL